LETEVRLRKSPQEDAGRVLKQSLPGGKVAEKGSKVLLAVGEASEVAKVPDLVGLSYPEAENSLEESGFLLGGVQEAHSETEPAGMIISRTPHQGRRWSRIHTSTSRQALARQRKATLLREGHPAA
jgi:beta-lactam-binding protein with PASTA domain